ncbi:hypothetical protein BOX15_Mlig024730g3 [Macrostomum lignano]|uniref:Sodium/glucose cotransporter n=1 Tax=Macrostomum lignano TaxID=282301 RepID=A0A267H0E7_9PLAT|nr:hypothetical protein BOX15_Mlig024730g3 [Macrostomum lignano]
METDFSLTVELTWIDYLVIALYLLATFAIGIFSAIREQRKSKTSSAGYFLAGRSMSWWTIALSLYMSNIGSNTFIGTAGSAAANGFGVLCYEFVGIYSLLLLAYLFVPVYLTSGAFTMPEYIKKRFGGKRMQILLAVQSLLMYVFAKLSLEVYAGSLIIQNTMGWDQVLSITVLLLMTAIYTMVGGLTTVIITDAVQGVIVVLGAGVLAVMSIDSIGGLGNLQSRFLASYPADYDNSTGCGAPDPQAFHMLRHIADPDYPWLGAFFGANILSAWHWCTDQLFVQRTLAARSLQHAKAGSVAAGFLKTLPLLLMIIPGMVSRIHYADIVACVNASACERLCGIPEGCSNVAYIEIIKQMLPTGVRGVMIAAMLAALISSITSIFNSGGTLFTIDLWLRLRPAAGEVEKVIVGRLFIVALTVIGVLWLPIVRTSGGGQLVIYAQSVTSYLTPPILTVFLMASLWPRTTEPGVFWGLLVSMVIGVVWMVLNFVYPPPQCGEADTRPAPIAQLHFLHFGIALFAFAALIMTAISLLTKPVDREQLAGLTWVTQNDQQQQQAEDPASAEPSSGAAGAEEVEETAQEEQQQQPEGLELKPVGDPSTPSASEPQTVMVHTPVSRRAFRFFLRWFCGFSDDDNGGAATEEERKAADTAEAAERARQLVAEMKSGSAWDRVVNCSALLLFAVGSFLWGLLA